MLRFTRGDLTPIPTAVIPITDMAKAMQRMARAEHIGKIVLKVQDDPDPWRSIFKKFQELYGHGIPVREGLRTFRRLLSANAVPYYVMALGKKIEDVGQAEHRIGAKRTTRPHLAVEYRAPTTADEEKLVRIWENAIGVAPIGIHDDFFDLGGDSIIAIQTQFSVADEFGINLSTSAFFDFPTVASLAEQIRKL
jgi:acyl carrier protein